MMMIPRIESTGARDQISLMVMGFHRNTNKAWRLVGGLRYAITTNTKCTKLQRR
jgi:hypothetical protein